MRGISSKTTWLAIGLLLWLAGANCSAAGVYARFMVVTPGEGAFELRVGGYIHVEPWYLPNARVDASGGAWTEWFDASKWPLHGRLDRSGGIAEWPAMRVTVARKGKGGPIHGCSLKVQLADAPSEQGVIHSFTENSESDTIAFLLPTPLREHAAEFETGSQMTARQLKWAREATGDRPVRLKQFTFITALWGHYDPGLARQAIETLKLLGFNVVGGYDAAELNRAGVRTYATIWNYGPSPKAEDDAWARQAAALSAAQKRAAAKGEATTRPAHYVIGDEVQTLDFRRTDAAELNGWFRDYLRSRGVGDDQLGKPINAVEFPAKAMFEKALPRDADLPTRRLLYYAAKFGHGWSARELARSANLIHSSIPGMQVETLPSDHGFFNAWGPPHIGMSYRMLDLFEVGAQRAVDQLSAEDWLGLNHMYGPQYTWTGAQSFGYFNAICRSARAEAPAGDPMLQRALITVSDDKYLRLKAFSALGQGVKSFFFWTFGPTYIGTENYWSDLRSEYDGIAKLGRTLEKAEPLLYPARPVRDPVAILYSVSHDIWHSDNAAAFTEKRLLWHALRHLHVQPDFLREEDVEAGRLKNYKVLYVTDWCITRAASARIDQWVRDGGVVYLSAGAATRDEFYEPFAPPFAAAVWADHPPEHLTVESHEYNERVDLPTLHPLTTAQIRLAGQGDASFALPVLGCRLPLRSDLPHSLAHFADGSPAGAVVTHGRGKVIAFGFLPMLAYGQGADFRPTTLEEHWPDPPRRLIQFALDTARVSPVAQCDHPVVETSLLTGPRGSVLLLANYTYQPIRSMVVDLKLNQPVTRATSTEGVNVAFEKTPTGVRLRLPLEWTDAVLLER
jgi:hypothetical protein